MFVLCVRFQLRKVIPLLILVTGFFVWLSSILHERPAKAETIIDSNRLHSEPLTAFAQIATWHDLKTAAQEKLRQDDGINGNKLFDVLNGNSLNFNYSDNFVSFSRRSAERIATNHMTTCNQECVRFRDILYSWPQHKPKAAIYYLAKANRLHLLNMSLTSLYHSFLYRFHYPVLVFLEADSRDLINRIFHSHVNIQLFFQEVNFDIPVHVNASAVKFDIKCLSHIGYRHMCHFHAKTVYEQAILVGLEYVWRLDDDSLLPEVINYDLFAFMRLHHLQYGYVKIHFDSYDCTMGLWEAVRLYVKLKHLKLSNLVKWTEPKIFYNNFEISAVSLWMSKSYQDYIHFIDQLGGIYYYRWGDAPIKSIAVALFLPEEATHLFTDITYQHGNFFKNVSYSSF